MNNKLFLILGILISTFANAGELTLQPGSKVNIKAGEEMLVSCEGSTRPSCYMRSESTYFEDGSAKTHRFYVYTLIGNTRNFLDSTVKFQLDDVEQKELAYQQGIALIEKFKKDRLCE